MNLKDKTVIVTGAARGIGAAMATRFAAEGASVVVADLDQGAVQTTAATFNGLGVACDVTCEDDIKALVKAAEAQFGPVELFCSNAGVCLGEATHSASADNDTWNLVGQYMSWHMFTLHVPYCQV